MRILVLFIIIIFVGGCKNKPNESELVDEMVKSAQASKVPLTESQIRNMTEKALETSKAPQFDFEHFLSVIKARNYEDAYSKLNDDLRKKWSKDVFEEDIQRLCESVGENWNPQQMEFMNYQTPTGPVCTGSYYLTDDFVSSYKMDFVCMNTEVGFKISTLKIVFPYQGDNGSEIKQKALDFLSAIQSLDVEKAKKAMTVQYKEQIQLSVLQQIRNIMWDSKSNDMKIGEIEESIIDGKGVYRVLADSQIQPLVKLEIFLEQGTPDMVIAGIHTLGRVKMN